MKKLGKILLFLFIFILLEKLLEFIIVPVSYKHFISKDMKNVISERGNVDMMAIGDSMIGTSLVPQIFESEIPGVSLFFNAASFEQSSDGSYYYLKDLLSRYTPKYIILGVDMPMFDDDRLSMKQEWERIKNPLVKAECFIEDIGIMKSLEYFPLYRYKSFVRNVPENLSIKLSKNYWNGIDTRSGEHYISQGYIGKDEPIEAKYIDDVTIWVMKDECEIQKSVAYFNRIIEMCNDKEIKVFMVANPIMSKAVLDRSDYDERMKPFLDIAAHNNVPLVDMSLYKERETCYPDAYFHDYDHMTMFITESYSKELCNVINRQLNNEDVSELFWDSAEAWRESICH